MQVQTLLKKAAALDIQMICPLHGPNFERQPLAFYIGKYLTWSSYEPEEDGVLVACASIHGNTKAAAGKNGRSTPRKWSIQSSIYGSDQR